MNLDSSLKTMWFHSVTVQSRRARHHSKWKRRWVGVIGSTRNGRRDTRCPSARRLAMVPEKQGLEVKVLPVSGHRPMRQLAQRVRVVRCDGLLDDWSVEGVLSLISA
ncbi:uncharacterized protein TNCV_3986901 [Trichonephila clavipes]|nr:uncharacterized protein TNCV_3986901 [Trichonephila clavipes]